MSLSLNERRHRLVELVLFPVAVALAACSGHADAPMTVLYVILPGRGGNAKAATAVPKQGQRRHANEGKRRRLGHGCKRGQEYADRRIARGACVDFEFEHHLIAADRL